MMLGKILAGKKAREDAGKNLKRLEEALAASRELGAWRIADDEIKSRVTRLVYEANRYIEAARKSEGAFYEPLVLDALDEARAAVSAWKKNENDSAVLQHIGVSGMPGGIVIPREPDPVEKTGKGETREKTLLLLQKSLDVFILKNSINAAGDPDAALAALADPDG